ncbi:MAG: MraZ protein [Polaribacter sp.]|jgi:MraZ protein
MFENIGEFECKLDAKGRFRIPTNLLSKYDKGMEFVVNRGFEKCLNLYPRPVWGKMVAKVNSLNPYKKKNRQFIRFIHRGASEAKPDSSDRILLTKTQMEHGGIEKEIILFAVNNYIEIWDKELYRAEMAVDPDAIDGISDIADEIADNLDYPENNFGNPET